MRREIGNWFAGREKIRDKSIRFPNLMEILKLGGDQTIKIDVYYNYSDCHRKYKMSSREVIEFIDLEFRPSDDRYFKGNNQVFYGVGTGYRHYIDLEAGSLENKIERIGGSEKTTQLMKKPYRTATLEYHNWHI